MHAPRIHANRMSVHLPLAGYIEFRSRKLCTRPLVSQDRSCSIDRRFVVDRPRRSHIGRSSTATAGHTSTSIAGRASAVLAHRTITVAAASDVCPIPVRLASFGFGLGFGFGYMLLGAHGPPEREREGRARRVLLALLPRLSRPPRGALVVEHARVLGRVDRPLERRARPSRSADLGRGQKKKLIINSNTDLCFVCTKCARNVKCYPLENSMLGSFGGPQIEGLFWLA